jgi:hypothetical protein
MDITSIDATEITLLAAAGADTDTTRYTLTGEVDEPRVDSTTFTVHLTKVDTEAIKIRAALATNDATTFVAFGVAFVSDQTGVAVSPIANTGAKPVRTYTEDTTPPALESFSLNMDTEMILLEFTETIKGASVTLGLMSLQSSNSGIVTSVDLGGGEYVVLDGESVEFKLSTAELNELKFHEDLATEQSNTFLNVAVDMLTDMAGVGIDGVVRGADSFDDDVTNPTVVSFAVSMVTDAETLTIVFDETVDVSSLAVSEIALQSAVDSNDAVFLSVADTASVDGTTLVIDMKKWRLMSSSGSVCASRPQAVFSPSPQMLSMI